MAGLPSQVPRRPQSPLKVGLSDWILLMIVYSVTVILNAEIESEWVAWMKEVHVPDVLRTGCFVCCRMGKVIDPAQAEPTYTLQYDCNSIEEYHRYRDTFAPALQKDHTERYAGRFRASRQLLEIVQD